MINKDKKIFIKSLSTAYLDFRLYFNKKYQSKNMHSGIKKILNLDQMYILDVGYGTGAQTLFLISKKENYFF